MEKFDEGIKTAPSLSFNSSDKNPGSYKIKEIVRK